MPYFGGESSTTPALPDQHFLNTFAGTRLMRAVYHPAFFQTFESLRPTPNNPLLLPPGAVRATSAQSSPWLNVQKIIERIFQLSEGFFQAQHQRRHFLPIQVKAIRIAENVAETQVFIQRVVKFF